jgi:hypothetical protein
MSSTLRSCPSASHVFTLAPPATAVAFDVMILDPAVAVDLIPAGPLHRARPRGTGSAQGIPRSGDRRSTPAVAGAELRRS